MRRFYFLIFSILCVFASFSIGQDVLGDDDDDDDDGGGGKELGGDHESPDFHGKNGTLFMARAIAEGPSGLNESMHEKPRRPHKFNLKRVNLTSTQWGRTGANGQLSSAPNKTLHAENPNATLAMWKAVIAMLEGYVLERDSAESSLRLVAGLSSPIINATTSQSKSMMDSSGTLALAEAEFLGAAAFGGSSNKNHDAPEVPKSKDSAGLTNVTTMTTTPPKPQGRSNHSMDDHDVQWLLEFLESYLGTTEEPTHEGRMRYGGFDPPKPVSADLAEHPKPSAADLAEIFQRILVNDTSFNATGRNFLDYHFFSNGSMNGTSAAAELESLVDALKADGRIIFDEQNSHFHDFKDLFQSDELFDAEEVGHGGRLAPSSSSTSEDPSHAESHLVVVGDVLFSNVTYPPFHSDDIHSGGLSSSSSAPESPEDGLQAFRDGLSAMSQTDEEKVEEDDGKQQPPAVLDDDTMKRNASARVMLMESKARDGEDGDAMMGALSTDSTTSTSTVSTPARPDDDDDDHDMDGRHRNNGSVISPMSRNGDRSNDEDGEDEMNKDEEEKDNDGPNEDPEDHDQDDPEGRSWLSDWVDKTIVTAEKKDGNVIEAIFDSIINYIKNESVELGQEVLEEVLDVDDVEAGISSRQMNASSQVLLAQSDVIEALNHTLDDVQHHLLNHSTAAAAEEEDKEVDYFLKDFEMWLNETYFRRCGGGGSRSESESPRCKILMGVMDHCLKELLRGRSFDGPSKAFSATTNTTIAAHNVHVLQDDDFGPGYRSGGGHGAIGNKGQFDDQQETVSHGLIGQSGKGHKGGHLAVQGSTQGGGLGEAKVVQESEKQSAMSSGHQNAHAMSSVSQQTHQSGQSSGHQKDSSVSGSAHLTGQKAHQQGASGSRGSASHGHQQQAAAAAAVAASGTSNHNAYSDVGEWTHRKNGQGRSANVSDSDDLDELPDGKDGDGFIATSNNNNNTSAPEEDNEEEAEEEQQEEEDAIPDDVTQKNASSSESEARDGNDGDSSMANSSTTSTSTMSTPAKQDDDMDGRQLENEMERNAAANESAAEEMDQEDNNDSYTNEGLEEDKDNDNSTSIQSRATINSTDNENGTHGNSSTEMDLDDEENSTDTSTTADVPAAEPVPGSSSSNATPSALVQPMANPNRTSATNDKGPAKNASSQGGGGGGATKNQSGNNAFLMAAAPKSLNLSHLATNTQTSNISRLLPMKPIRNTSDEIDKHYLGAPHFNGSDNSADKNASYEIDEEEPMDGPPRPYWMGQDDNHEFPISNHHPLHHLHPYPEYESGVHHPRPYPPHYPEYEYESGGHGQAEDDDDDDFQNYGPEEVFGAMQTNDLLDEDALNHFFDSIHQKIQHDVPLIFRPGVGGGGGGGGRAAAASSMCQKDADCNPRLKEVCRENRVANFCDCPNRFVRHPITRVCRHPSDLKYYPGLSRIRRNVESVAMSEETENGNKIEMKHNQVFCDPNLCSNHGICYFTNSSTTVCSCYTWYFGENCQIDALLAVLGLLSGMCTLTVITLIFGLLYCWCTKTKKGWAPVSQGQWSS